MLIGWGNMGGGLTYLIMPQLFNGFALVLPVHTAWRATFIVPAVACILVGLMDYFFVDDCPEGDWLQKKKSELTRQKEPEINENVDLNLKSDQKETEENFENQLRVIPTDNSSTDPSESTESYSAVQSVVTNFFSVLKDPTVSILMLHYACAFGLELAVDNIIGNFFHVRFGLDQTTSGM